VINCSTSAAGSVPRRDPGPGRSAVAARLAESIPIIGDEIDRVVAWKTETTSAPLSGRPVGCASC